MADTLVKVEHVSKKFCRDLKTGLWYGVKDMVGEMLGRKNEKRELRPKEFWALRDVSFELKRGECLGLIGHNGAGKSTLLKILNGLIKPDAGKVEIRGRIGALIELGAGFNPILSGRENIYVNGQILGFSKKEIDSKFESIVNFAELEDFIDTAVQYYSSGMKVRLGFAIAAQMEPDVLIIDEVLAVGDIGFRMKCLNTIGKLLANTAVIFVSHTMPQIARICNQIQLLNKGRVQYYGNDVSRGIEEYFDLFKTTKGNIIGDGKISVLRLEINNSFRENSEYVTTYGSSLLILLKLRISKEVKRYWINFSFVDKDSKAVANFFSQFSGVVFDDKGDVEIKAITDNITLGLGVYEISVAINGVNDNGTRGEIHYYNSNLAILKVTGIPSGLAPVQFVGEWQVN